MSNEQQRWVKILPSAVHSEYGGWSNTYIGEVYRLLGKDSDGDFRLSLAPYRIEPEHTQDVFVYDEPREVVQPKQWRLKVDVPEWGLKKGQHSEYISNNMAKFSWQDYTASIPLSIMPYIADPVVEDESQSNAAQR